METIGYRLPFVGRGLLGAQSQFIQATQLSAFLSNLCVSLCAIHECDFVSAGPVLSQAYWMRQTVGDTGSMVYTILLIKA